MSHEKDIPSTSKPALCKQKTRSNQKCNKPAIHTISGQVDIMGRLVPVTLQVCDDHLPRVQAKWKLTNE